MPQCLKPNAGLAGRLGSSGCNLSLQSTRKKGKKTVILARGGVFRGPR
jgi:hypothetical protein